MFSRRALIGRLLTLAGIVGLVPRGHAAETPAKVSKAAAKYQDTPKNGQTCAMCKFYIAQGGRAGGAMMGDGHTGGMMGSARMGAMMAPGTCEVVEGSISPQGWCILYRPISG